jgi:hypothetical protein
MGQTKSNRLNCSATERLKIGAVTFTEALQRKP